MFIGHLYFLCVCGYERETHAETRERKSPFLSFDYFSFFFWGVGFSVIDL